MTEYYRLPIAIANILGILLVIFVALLSVHQFKLLNDNHQLLSVSATAKTEAIQDTATITVGVVSDGLTAQAAQEQNNSNMNQVLSFIKQVGIDPKDIKTSQFYISPKYNYNNQKQTIVGYQANQTITVKVKNVNKSSQQLQKIVDGAVMHGANQIQGINFSFENDEELMQQARKQAIDKAIANAKQIAQDAGLKLGKVVNVTTTANDNPGPMLGANMMLAKSSSTQIELGTQEVFATVTVLFKIN